MGVTISCSSHFEVYKGALDCLGVETQHGLELIKGLGFCAGLLFCKGPSTQETCNYFRKTSILQMILLLSAQLEDTPNSNYRIIFFDTVRQHSPGDTCSSRQPLGQ